MEKLKSVLYDILVIIVTVIVTLSVYNMTVSYINDKNHTEANQQFEMVANRYGWEYQEIKD